MQASAPVLDTLARVLHLDDDERGYLFQPAGKITTRTRSRGRQRVQPQLQRVTCPRAGCRRPGSAAAGCPTRIACWTG
ncbi:hypothetical protein [Streptomyces sp. AK010]|uniref:hypothetical protein n=1 Tax=Streptomyces sp. AK010 TaxID=2723074 RepID=UPI0017B12EA0|nr:hypothetical protein [Streptomyces sp. AK010]MBB6419888.1 hypothetical protein [Streptomyces sp. AK010]